MTCEELAAHIGGVFWDSKSANAYTGIWCAQRPLRDPIRLGRTYDTHTGKKRTGFGGRNDAVPGEQGDAEGTIVRCAWKTSNQTANIR